MGRQGVVQSAIIKLKLAEQKSEGAAQNNKAQPVCTTVLPISSLMAVSSTLAPTTLEFIENNGMVSSKSCDALLKG
jgi:hypothetical protein